MLVSTTQMLCVASQRNASGASVKAMVSSQEKSHNLSLEAEERREERRARERAEEADKNRQHELKIAQIYATMFASQQLSGPGPSTSGYIPYQPTPPIPPFPRTWLSPPPNHSSPQQANANPNVIHYRSRDDSFVSYEQL